MDEFEKNLIEGINKTLNKSNKKEKLKKAKIHVEIDDCVVVKGVSQKGKSGRQRELRPEERETLRFQLIQYFGASKVDKYLLGVDKIPELSERLCNMRDKMEREIILAEKEQELYFEMIDVEYKKLGRPNAVFTWREFDYLCSIACTLNEIAGFFDLHPDTLRRRVKEEFGLTFAEYYERRSQGIKIALRRAQIHNAIDGDTQMQKFLGINLLGQKQKIDFDGQVQVNTFADLVKNLDNKVKGKQQTNGTDGKNNTISNNDEIDND